jgi:hypothetical protein
VDPNDNHSETRERRGSLRPDTPYNNPDTLSRILAEQVAINKKLLNKGSSLPIQLPYFHGRANENVQTWLFQLNSTFKAKNIADEEAVFYLTTCLKEAALHWYQNQATKACRETPFRTLILFAEAIKEAFEPPHYQQILRRQLRALKQKDSVQKYVYEFRNLVGQIEGMEELDQVMLFIDGLKQATRIKVNYKSSNTLEEAITAAISYDTARFGPARAYLPPQTYYNQNRSRTHHSRDDGGVRPMELDRAEGHPYRTQGARNIRH